MISINYYFTGKEQRLGGEFEAPSVRWVRSLKLITISRVRHSTVSLHRVHLLSSFQFSWLCVNVILLAIIFLHHCKSVIYYIYVYYV